MRVLSVLFLGAALLMGCEKKPASLTLEPREFLPLDKKGKTVQLKAQTKDDRGIFLATVVPAYSSGDATVASVDDKGLITATGSGKTQITGTVGELTASVPVEVRIVGSVEVEPNTPQKMRMSRTMKVKITIKDDKGNVMPGEKFTLRTPGNCIDADPDGTITAQATGESTLVVQARDKEARVKFEVTD